MRRHPRAFRPADLESLEGRVVLSSVNITINIGNPLQSFLVQVRDARKASQAFATFRKNYNDDIKSILLKAGSDGTIDIAGNRAAFNAKVLTDIQALNASLADKFKNLPTPTTLATNIQNKLLGSDPKTLESRLKLLATPTESKGFSMRVFRLNSALAITIANAQVDQLIRRDRHPGNTGGTTTTSHS